MSQSCDVSQISENLFIGGLEAAELAMELKFTSMLTVDIALPFTAAALVSIIISNLSPNLIHFQRSLEICITDQEDSDLLSYLPSAISFIQGLA